MVSKPWHEDDAEEFARILPELEREYPYLHVTTRDGNTVLVGELPLVLDRRVIDQFEIEVTVSGAGPSAEIPIVREIGGRIPRCADRHVNADSGAACLCVEDEYWFRNPQGLDLIEFLRGPVTAYFVGQLSFEQGNGWPFGQRSHGADGILEFYEPLLGTRDSEIVQAILETVAMKNIYGRWPCPCGSGRRINACHGEAIRNLRSRVPRESILKSIRALEVEFGKRALQEKMI